MAYGENYEAKMVANQLKKFRLSKGLNQLNRH